MQTFLPHWNYVDSARALDRRRLGKQRIEVLQILRALSGQSRGWENHPAVKMWRGYEHELVAYGLAMCAEWIRRGYSDTTAPKIAAFDERYHHQRNGKTPPWLGDAALHEGHRAHLMRKDSTFYRFFENTNPDAPLVWPVQ